jgi:hypothetical protein
VREEDQLNGELDQRLEKRLDVAHVTKRGGRVDGQASSEVLQDLRDDEGAKRRQEQSNLALLLGRDRKRLGAWNGVAVGDTSLVSRSDRVRATAVPRSRERHDHRQLQLLHQQVQLSPPLDEGIDENELGVVSVGNAAHVLQPIGAGSPGRVRSRPVPESRTQLAHGHGS